MNQNNINPNIKCVLFDLDNTLVEIPDAWHYFDQLIIDVMEKDFHLPVPTSAERDTLWRTGKEYVSILQQWGIKEHKKFWFLFDRRDGEKRLQYIKEQKLRVYPESLDVLEKLQRRQIKLGVITNTPTFIAENELSVFNLRQFFDIVLGLGENQEICKPEPDGIIFALQQFTLNASEAVFVGDSLVDLIAAKRAHVIPIFIDRTKEKKIESSEITEKDFKRISTLSEIFSIL